MAKLFIYKLFLNRLLAIILIMLFAISTKANSVSPTILVISSYNPEAQNVSDNISDFVVEFDRLGGKVSVMVESMNCKNLSEAFAWPSRMEDILSKYQGSNEPALILLLGQEAWATYLSLEGDYVRRVPVMCGMASRN
ncbi:MAG: two-component sensor histidine kinase, partial [Phocaeicola sp.]